MRQHITKYFTNQADPQDDQIVKTIEVWVTLEDAVIASGGAVTQQQVLDGVDAGSGQKWVRIASGQAPTGFVEDQGVTEEQYQLSLAERDYVANPPQ